MYASEAFGTLPPSAMKLYVDMRTQLNGYNNGRIDATMRTLRYRGWASTETLQRAIVELLGRGLIDRTRHGKPGPARICSLYRFTDLPTPKDDRRMINGRPATLEFRNWHPKKSGASEIEATLLRKSGRYRFENRSVAASAASKSEAQKKPSIARKPAPVLVSR